MTWVFEDMVVTIVCTTMSSFGLGSGGVLGNFNRELGVF